MHIAHLGNAGINWSNKPSPHTTTAERYSGRCILAKQVLLATEDFDKFIKSVEKGWIRSFGQMKVLQVDERCAWSSEKVGVWCSENGIELSISPGQSHSKLAILERRHQVTRRALTIFMMDNPNPGLPLREYVVRAINYVIPQINRHPNVRGYSPEQ